MRFVAMEISIYSLLEGATRATGSAAVIDVFRAFTSAAVAPANGVYKIVMVRTVEEALALRYAGIGQICMGEIKAGHRMALNSATRRRTGPTPCPRNTRRC
jgi:2-phosphosulfolactate phosphatase